MKNLARALFGKSAATSAPADTTNLLELCKVQSGDGGRTNSSYGTWQGVLPIPPLALVRTTGSTSLESFYVVAEAWAQKVLSFLSEPGKVLDIGCGCGKTARFLALSEKVENYIGFDVIPECVEWCNNFIKPFTAGRFEFRYADLYSYGYNSTGTKAVDYQFPAAAGSISVAFGASLFTHLTEEEVKHYLAESARVLVSGGKLLTSIHTSPKDGEAFSLGGATGKEHRTDVTPGYFGKLAADAGLSLYADAGELCGQHLLVFKN